LNDLQVPVGVIQEFRPAPRPFLGQDGVAADHQAFSWVGWIGDLRQIHLFE
jgi:hypothetical protein